MIFAADVGTTFELGPFIIRIALRPDNPAFARYLVFKGDRLVGRQFSRPCLSDCEWLDRERVVYALAEQSKQDFKKYSAQWPARRPGRPKKADAERQLQEAMMA